MDNFNSRLRMLKSIYASKVGNIRPPCGPCGWKSQRCQLERTEKRSLSHQRLLVQWKNFVRSSKIGTRNPAYGCLTNPASSKQQTSNHTISQPAKKRALRESSMRNGYAALAASARSTRNAACQHAVSSHRGFAIQRIM